jgi:bacterioferritin-associated ferredoxin
MIVCSCNVFSEADVRMAIANTATRPRMSRVYASLGCAAKCGRCARTIKSLIDDVAGCATCGEACGGRSAAPHHA